MKAAEYVRRKRAKRIDRTSRTAAAAAASRRMSCLRSSSLRLHSRRVIRMTCSVRTLRTSPAYVSTSCASLFAPLLESSGQVRGTSGSRSPLVAKSLSLLS